MFTVLFSAQRSTTNSELVLFCLVKDAYCWSMSAEQRRVRQLCKFWQHKESIDFCINVKAMIAHTWRLPACNCTCNGLHAAYSFSPSSMRHRVSCNQHGVFPNGVTSQRQKLLCKPYNRQVAVLTISYYKGQGTGRLSFLHHSPSSTNSTVFDQSLWLRPHTHSLQ